MRLFLLLNESCIFKFCKSVVLIVCLNCIYDYLVELEHIQLRYMFQNVVIKAEKVAIIEFITKEDELKCNATLVQHLFLIYFYLSWKGGTKYSVGKCQS